MKKSLALLLAVVMSLCAVPALAEDTAVSPVEDGMWVSLPEYGMEFCVPSDWLEAKLTDEDTQSGMLCTYANPEKTRAVVLFDEGQGDLDSFAKDMEVLIGKVYRYSFNGIPFIAFEVEATKSIALATQTSDGTGLLMFVFYPMTSNSFFELAKQIAASLRSVE